MNVNKPDTSGWNKKEWKNYLDSELGDIEGEFGNTSDVKESISNLEYKTIVEGNGLSIYTYDDELIGYIRKGRFSDSTNNIDSENHLEKYVNEEYRGRGYGVVLINEYISSGFTLPDEEYTGDMKVVRLMEKFGYRAVSYFEHGVENPIYDNNFTLLEGQVVKMEKS